MFSTKKRGLVNTEDVKIDKRAPITPSFMAMCIEP